VLLVGAALWPVRPAEAGPTNTLLDESVLVDESGSLSSSDVAAEIKAVTTIASGGLNHNNRVSVYGFGSQNTTEQNAITLACPPEIIDTSVKITALAGCVQKIHRRSDAEGNDTDHVKALAQAIETLTTSSPPGALKVVFLLTDGRLDVHRSDSYGRISADRNTEAERQLKTQLALAASDKIEIWPLGFGAQIDRAELDAFAAGGSQQSCDGRPDSQPKARVVTSSADVLRSLSEAFASASCSGVSPTDSTTLGPGQTRTLHLAIPAIATDGTINVSKVDPAVRVEFIDPNGHVVPASGSIGVSTFEEAGESTDQETMRITNPISGTWGVRLTAPQNMAKSLVSAVAIWQGAVSSSLAVDPQIAHTGQRLTIRLSLVTRTGAITDPRALAGLNFTVQVTGAGLTGPQSIPIRDDGQAPDDIKNDGRYAGTYEAPAAQGRMTFVGVVTGPGIQAEKLPTTIQVSDTAQVAVGQVRFGNHSGTVHPGDSVPVDISLENPTNAVINARVTAAGPGTQPSLSGASAVAVKPGKSAVRYRLTFPKDGPFGGRETTVQVVDAANGSVITSGPLVVTVKSPPGIVARNKSKIAGGILLLLAAAIVLALRREAHRRKVDVRGLKATLSRDGNVIGDPLKAPSKWSPVFRFVLRDARLDFPQPGDSVITARRGTAGMVVVRTAEGTKYDVEVGTEGESFEDSGLMLGFTDTRRAHRAGQRRKQSGNKRSSQDPDPKPSEDEWAGASGGQTDYDNPWI
jgi:hypothetical protein